MPYKDKEERKRYAKEYHSRPETKARKKVVGKIWREKNPGHARAWAIKNAAHLSRLSRNAHLKRKYGITTEEVEQMLAAQGGLCAICKTDKPKSNYDKWSVDHCHQTGRIRGILCNPCNAGLGALGDTVEHLLRAIEYLSR